MSKRILLITDVGSFWSKRYVENLLLPNGWEVVIFPIWEKTGRFDAYYRENGVTVYNDAHTLPVVRRSPRLRMWARIAMNANKLKRYGPFDAIHNHYLSQRDLALGYRLHRAFPQAKWVCSFWGSDLLRSTGVDLRRMERYLAACDHITVHSALHIKRVREVFGEAASQKTALVYFGQTVYDDIDRVRKLADKAACKEHFGLPADKPVICLGYNASPTHKHLELLKGLKTLPEETLRGWSLVLQMTYGSFDDSYFDTVREAAEALPCRTLVLTEFMPLVGGADKVVVIHIHQLPKAFNPFHNMIHICLRGYALVLGFAFDFLAVLVRAGHKIHIIAFLLLKTGHVRNPANPHLPETKYGSFAADTPSAAHPPWQPAARQPP